MRKKGDKVAILYGSKTRSGNTVQAAERLKEVVGDADVYHADDVRDASLLRGYSRFIFLTPTVGNEELSEPFEALFDQRWIDFSDAFYTICELGNYYGFELFEYGAAKILHQLIAASGGKEFYHTLSLDTLPVIDWERFNAWAEGLRASLVP
jgi:flavodoxin